MKKKIALIYGGEGCEREISKKSAEALLSFIDRKEFEVLPIEIEKDGTWRFAGGICRGTATFPVYLDGRHGFLRDGGIERIDCAVISLHGDMGEDGSVQGALDTAHIPYVGESVSVSALTSDKALTKTVAESLGIPTSEFITVDPLDGEGAAMKAAEAILGYPMFIKPRRLGSSIGASPVFKREDFRKAYLKAQEAPRGGGIMIEKLVRIAYELECACLGTGGEVKCLAGGTVKANGFYDYEKKYGEGGALAIADLSRVSDGIRRRAEAHTRTLVREIGINSISRIDFFVTPDGQLLFNEINSIPGMTRTSLFPALTELMGLPRGEFINSLIREKIG